MRINDDKSNKSQEKSREKPMQPLIKIKPVPPKVHKVIKTNNISHIKSSPNLHFPRDFHPHYPKPKKIQYTISYSQKTPPSTTPNYLSNYYYGTPDNGSSFKSIGRGSNPYHKKF